MGRAAPAQASVAGDQVGSVIGSESWGGQIGPWRPQMTPRPPRRGEFFRLTLEKIILTALWREPGRC